MFNSDDPPVFVPTMWFDPGTARYLDSVGPGHRLGFLTLTSLVLVAPNSIRGTAWGMRAPLLLEECPPSHRDFGIPKTFQEFDV